MLVRNWMQTEPTVIGSDMLLAEAKQLLSESNLHALPVVDDGRLRGVLTRAICLRAAHCVLRTQSSDELNFFNTHVKVKDVMVRNPVTVNADDTMEQCLQIGQQHGVGQMPVMEGGHVVGVISAIEMFSLAAHFLGAWEQRSGVTIAPVQMQAGTVGRIIDIVEGAGAEVLAVYPIALAGDPPHGAQRQRKVIVRFHAPGNEPIVEALAGEGFTVIESVERRH